MLSYSVFCGAPNTQDLKSHLIDPMVINNNKN
uniref:Uncharacterized protein n=1 Tax=Anguilla anguilla TaxID=7936 RepID=A0A0E9UUF4_ANGAN